MDSNNQDRGYNNGFNSQDSSYNNGFNNQDNNYDNGFGSQDSQNEQDDNPYNDPNYSNPSFPKDRSVVSGPGHFEQNAGRPSLDGQGTYGQNGEAYSRDNNEAYSQNSYGQNNGAYPQNPYGQNNGQYPNNPNSKNNAQNNPAQGLETASLVMGILSLICCGSLIFSIIGLVFIAIAKSKTDKLSGVGIGGLVCCIISLVFGIIAILLVVLLGAGFIPEFFEPLNGGYGL